ncbi:hypothetical protein GA0061078_0692 [Bifidobacterium bohemicum]|uniref:Uncharacterized protein n=1 Tax=Bifidobacterium bohemicum DSM 22767 TaxID=1437606 RepID=A0A086ZK86_9BIFI|nr:hypothetical protein BBOH_0410 [Bifidobacterium bohemicum DSM 22767]SCB85582.1 hypothetical protein GA0061078_0692 [Bifidobacterium bohemicum]
MSLQLVKVEGWKQKGMIVMVTQNMNVQELATVVGGDPDYWWKFVDGVSYAFGYGAGRASQNIGFGTPCLYPIWRKRY